MNLISIPVFQNNYIWLLKDMYRRCIIIDPGESKSVLNAVKNLLLTPTAILLTHHHYDHVDGVSNIRARYPDIIIYGPEETVNKGTTHIVSDGDIIKINDRNYITVAVPGHTLNHVAFYSQPYLFCGDTIFSAGSGKLFEGSAKQMYESFQKINIFPDNTLICCGHEYTLSNIKFARFILPTDTHLKIYEKYVTNLRAKGKPSIPTTLQLERKINLFFRCHEIHLQNTLGFYSLKENFHLVFAELRRRKDCFFF